MLHHHLSQTNLLTTSTVLSLTFPTLKSLVPYRVATHSLSSPSPITELSCIPLNIHIPANQNMLAVPTSLPASQAFYSVDHTSSLYTAPQTPGLNTQLELHSHRLNMIEAHMIQSSRISLLESKINQTQKPNFNLELPSIAAYHAQNRAVQDGGELCHCGLESAVKTVLAPGDKWAKFSTVAFRRAATSAPSSTGRKAD